MKRIERNEPKCDKCPYKIDKWRKDGNTMYYAGTYCTNRKEKCIRDIK